MYKGTIIDPISLLFTHCYFFWEVCFIIDNSFCCSFSRSKVSRLCSDMPYQTCFGPLPHLLNGDANSRAKSPFRFENKRFNSPGKEQLEVWWSSYRILGSPSFILAKKLLKDDLSKWNIKIFGNTHVQKAKLMKDIQNLDVEEQNNDFSDVDGVAREGFKANLQKI